VRIRHAAGSTRSGSGESRRGEGGETLVEVLVMIVLMGVGFAAIFSGLMTVSRINDANARRTKASDAIQSWAEGLQQPARSLTGSPTNPYTYVDCATAATYGREGQPNNLMPTSWANEPMNQAPVKVEYLSGYDANGEPQFYSDVNVCYSSMVAGKDKGLQRITLKVETPAGQKPRVVDTLVILKRRQTCPPVTNTSDGSSRFDNADLGPC